MGRGGIDPVNSAPSRQPTACPFYINTQLLDEMRSHVMQVTPEEACGLVAGTSTEALAVIPMINTLHSPWRYRMHPADQLRVFNDIDRQGWELLAIYHSHPLGPAFPSETDIAEAYYPEAVYLIWSYLDEAWRLRAFNIRDREVTEVTLPT